MARVKVSLVGSKNENVKKDRSKFLFHNTLEYWEQYQELYDAAATVIDKIKYELTHGHNAKDTLAAVQMWVDNYLLEEPV